MTLDNLTAKGSPVSSRLLEHSKEAMVAALEIYNKPTITYRNECTVILIVNSWELVLKALLIENKHSIYGRADDPQTPKRTITWRQAWQKSQQFLPSDLATSATYRNLETLAKYRDQAIHYYGSQDLGISLYLLFQAAIVNYRDLVKHTWSVDIGDDITWHLLPIGMKPPFDIVSYLGHVRESSDGSAVSTFLADIGNTLDELVTSDEDVDRFLIRATVRLESVKKTDRANIDVGVKGRSGHGEPSVVVRPQDPNQSHPFRQKEMLAKIKEAGDRKLTQHVFQAIVRKYGLKSKSKYCWVSSGRELTKYSFEAVKLIRRLSAGEVNDALAEYSNFLYVVRKRERA